MRNRLLFLSLVCIPVLLTAQVDTTDLPSAPLEEAVEDLILNSGIDEQVDYSDYLEPLENLARSPLDLNSARYEQLLVLPGMTGITAQRLIHHRNVFGDLTSIYELQAIEGYNMTLIRGILPYVTVDRAGAKDLDPELRFPRGPSFQEVLAGLEGEWLQRSTFIVEDQQGYSDPDTTFKEVMDLEGNIRTDTTLSSRYQGSPLRHYTRLRFRMGNYVKFGLVGESDPGELFTWDPNNKQYGYDYLSAHFALQNFGRVKRLLIGDYTLQFGQGLILSRGLGFGKGAQVISGLKMPAYGARPYMSVNENQYFRGAAATIGAGDFEITVFGSRAFRDASFQAATDTLDEEILQVGNLQTSGFHRTISEQANRKVIGETAFGGRLEYNRGTFRGGITHYQLQYDAPLNPGTASYQRFAFRGDHHYLTGADWDWVKGNINLFGEAAMDKSGALAGTVSLMSSISSTVDASVNVRHFDKDFFSPFAYVFAERPTAAQNETAIYLGLKYTPSYNWELQTYFDQYQFAWHRFRVSYPSNGFEWMAQATYKFNRSTNVALRLRTEQTQRNPNSEVTQILGSPVQIQRDQFRIHFSTNIDRQLSLKTRLEGSRFREADRADQFGWLLYQDLSWKYGYRWKITARYAVFNIDSYDARIYAYENDILGFFSIPPYNGRGTRWYAILNGKLGHGWEFWARIAQTHLTDACSYEALEPAQAGLPAGNEFVEVCTFGTGLEGIEADTRTEVKLQLRWKF